MAADGFIRQQFVQRLYVEHHGWLNGWLRRHLQLPKGGVHEPVAAYRGR